MAEVAVVTLSPEEVAEAASLAEAALAYWQSTGRRGHYSNNFNSHFVGKLGELAVEAWVQSLGTWVASPFRDVRVLDTEDITAAKRLEVKSWDEPGWAAWGRCVRPNQVDALAAKADAIVWCSVDGAKEQPGTVPVSVTIHGWSTVDYVRACPITLTGPGYRRLENHQIDVGDMRSLDEL
jgi:hypothetical protein